MALIRAIKKIGRVLNKTKNVPHKRIILTYVAVVKKGRGHARIPSSPPPPHLNVCQEPIKFDGLLRLSRRLGSFRLK